MYNKSHLDFLETSRVKVAHYIYDTFQTELELIRSSTGNTSTYLTIPSICEDICTTLIVQNNVLNNSHVIGISHTGINQNKPLKSKYYWKSQKYKIPTSFNNGWFIARADRQNLENTRCRPKQLLICVGLHNSHQFQRSSAGQYDQLNAPEKTTLFTIVSLTRKQLSFYTLITRHVVSVSF